MKSLRILGAVASFIVPSMANAEKNPQPVEIVAPISASVLASARDRADVAVARSVINSNQIKGTFAENLTSAFILNGGAEVGKWQAVSPRLGPQGLDHVAVRLDRLGRPRGLLVGETKYGTSRLGQTQSGLQMGPEYTGKRLAGLATRLRTIAQQIEMGISDEPKPPAINARYAVNVPLDDRTSVTFWRDRKSSNGWKYDGPVDLLEKSRDQLLLLSDYLGGASDGRISFAKRIFVWKLNGRNLLLSVLDANGLQEGMSLANLPRQVLPPIDLSVTRWTQDAFKDAYSSELMKQLPSLSEDDSLLLANEAYAVYEPMKGANGLLLRSSYSRFAMARSNTAGMLGVATAAPVDVAFQAWEGGKIDWSRVAGVSAASGLSAAAGTYVGGYTTLALTQSQFGYTLTSRAAGLVGLPSGTQMANLTGEFTGGGVTAALFAYIGYGLGYYDLSTANRSAFAGVAGSAGGVMASAATMGLLAAYGTASTGVAISTLSGAAATNASLALLGGGTVAGGGLGVAGGAVVAGTGVGVVVIGVTAATMYGFHIYDKVQEDKRIGLTLLDLQQHYAAQ